MSDVHLGAFSDEKNNQPEQELIQLIDFAEEHHYQIALLGDLFDYWIEYPNHTPSLGKNLLHRFSQFHRTSPSTLFITGNHDNWTLGHFAALGFDVEPNCRFLTIDEYQILLAHGDATGHHPQHLKRPLLHRFIRNKLFLKIYRNMLAPKAGLKVMEIFSRCCRFLKGEHSNPAKLDRWANKMLQNTPANMVLCGHDHVPRIHKYHYGTYINLGTFYRHHSLVEYNNGRFSLVKWNSDQQQLRSFQPQQLAHE